MANPILRVLAGPNGAGKSTLAASYLPAEAAFVNADEVARTRPTYPSAAADREAGRIVLETMADFEARGGGFAFETTLSTRALASRIARLRRAGYLFHLILVWSLHVQFSIARFATRVRAGGHHIPQGTIRRRYTAGLVNFFRLYRPLADRWEVFENMGPGLPYLVASGSLGDTLRIDDRLLWDQIRSDHELGRLAVAVNRDRQIDEMTCLMGVGVRDVLREHKRRGQSIVVWDREDQRAVEISAEEIVVPEIDDALRVGRPLFGPIPFCRA